MKKLICYTDGSFSEELQRYSFGLVVLNTDKEVISTDCGRGSNPSYLQHWQVSGEILASLKAVDYAIRHNATDLEICYDYLGIEKWATGEWKGKKELTRSYASYMGDAITKVNITFKKVKAHSGDKYNDMADALASKGMYS